MNTYSTSPPKPGLIEENAARFENDLNKADSVRANGVTGLLGLRAQKVKSRLREVDVIAARLGDDDPEVINLKAAVAADQRFVLELSAEADRATTTRPGRDSKRWTVYGFVRNQELEGQANLTVALFDRADRWIEAVGYACTDTRGYFQLGCEPGSDNLREVFIRVSNRKPQVLYRDTKPMAPVLGEVKYREIILNGECDCCQPPSDPSSPEPPSSKKQPAKPKPSKTKAPAKARKANKS